MSLQKPDQRMSLLAKKWLEGKITEQEKEEYDQWYHSFDDTYHEMNSAEGEQKMSQRLQESIFAKAGIQQIPVTKKLSSVYKIAVAASVMFLLSIGLYYNYNKQQVQQYTIDKAHDLAPGKNQAVLTLANGQQIALNQSHNGVLAKQGDASIRTTADGQISYNADQATEKKTAQQEIYNTITIPNGGQYELTLADGTKVWLNAASSLKYPATFKGTERNVELTGEAYFEVAKNKHMPFKVHSGNQLVEVLGTHFNINTYEGLIKTTLLEGSVKVSAGSANTVIRPGNQAQTDKQSNQINVIQNADLSESIAWKNGLFQFKDADVETIMKALARWYNVKIAYEGEIPQRTFSGKIYRNVNISQVLEILKYADIHFKVEKSTGVNQSSKIIVIP